MSERLTPEREDEIAELLPYANACRDYALVREWMEEYRAEIDRLRADLLQAERDALAESEKLCEERGRSRYCRLARWSSCPTTNA